MKILVLSDSHGNLPSMRRAVELERPDEILHLGDYIRDAEQLERAFPAYPVWMVPGNCDRGRPEEPVLQLTRDGIRLYLTHGHLHHVKFGLRRLEYAAMEAEAQVALFGHTHRPYLEQYAGIWFLNPGAIGYGRSYGLIWIENGAVRCELKCLPEEDAT